MKSLAISCMLGSRFVIMSARFGIGRFTTEEEIDYTVKKCLEKVEHLRKMR